MKGRATGNEGADGRDRRVSHFMKVPAAVALLRERHGELIARKIALTEQQRARRARSKKRFAFWAEVAAQIENGNGAAKEVTGMGEHPKIRPSRCAPHLKDAFGRAACRSLLLGKQPAAVAKPGDFAVRPTQEVAALDLAVGIGR